MLCKVRSLGLQGISGYEVTAECDLAGGLPNFDIVGLPDTAVKEARERAAIKNSGYAFPVGRITVNLAPANRRKSGTVYDLPILLGNQLLDLLHDELIEPLVYRDILLTGHHVLPHHIGLSINGRSVPGH